MDWSDVAAIQQFLARDETLVDIQAVEAWLLEQPRDLVMRAWSDENEQLAWAEQLWEETQSSTWLGSLAIGASQSNEAAYAIASCAVGDHATSLCRLAPTAMRWFLSALAHEATEKSDSATLELLLSSSFFCDEYTEKEMHVILNHIARTWARRSSCSRDQRIDVLNVLLAHGVHVQCLQLSPADGTATLVRSLARNGVSYIGYAGLFRAPASTRYHDESLQQMLELGADPRGGSLATWHNLITNSSVEAVWMLVSKWCVDVDSRRGDDMLMWTPLMLAMGRNDSRIVKMLLDRQADLTLTDTIGRTALAIAAQTSIYAVVELLLTSGADPSMPDRDGRTPLDHAMGRSFPAPHVAELLRRYGTA